MDETPTLNRAELMQELRADIEELLTKVADAVDHARPGRIIADSEGPARQAFAQFRERVYAKTLQKRLDAAEAAFPPLQRTQPAFKEFKLVVYYDDTRRHRLVWKAPRATTKQRDA